MTRAFKKGYFDNKRQVLSFITDIKANLHRKTRGKCFTDSLNDLYTWMRIKGGPLVIRFLQDNMDGPGNYRLNLKQTNNTMLLLIMAS